MSRDPEARIIYALCVIISVPVIVIAFARGQTIGAGTTLCIFIAAFGVIGLVLEWRRRVRVPRARVVHHAKPVAARSQPRTAHDDAVLIVEDEPGIRQPLHLTLSAHGFRVIEATTLAEARDILASVRPAVVLLDLGLPDGDGLELLRARAAPDETSVIVMSARDREYDKIAALDAGADDYVLKPFDAGDLLVRVQLAIKRRRASRARIDDGPFAAGPFQIDPAQGTVSIDGKDVTLTPTELRLLIALARQPGKVFTHRQLLDALWGDTTHGVYELRVHVAALRRKLESDPVRPRFLVTETGAGYRLRVD